MTHQLRRRRRKSRSRSPSNRQTQNTRHQGGKIGKNTPLLKLPTRKEVNRLGELGWLDFP
tara:strand:+ start:9149 stop:9328 length:180 start_codon:yes stop_codon:yes gene_type:complete